MSDDFKPIGGNILNLNLENLPILQQNLNSITAHNREMERAVQATQKERERKEANEEAYRQESIRSLRAIEQNTANLYTLVDLISKSNEQQEELIEIIAEVLTIAKAKTKGEAESTYRKVMGKISQTVEDAEALGKIAGFATTVWNLAQPIIEKLQG